MQQSIRVSNNVTQFLNVRISGDLKFLLFAYLCLLTFLIHLFILTFTQQTALWVLPALGYACGYNEQWKQKGLRLPGGTTTSRQKRDPVTGTGVWGWWLPDRLHQRGQGGSPENGPWTREREGDPGGSCTAEDGGKNVGSLRTRAAWRWGDPVRGGRAGRRGTSSATWGSSALSCGSQRC